MYALPGAGFVRYRSKSTEYAEAEKATRGPNGHVIFAHRRGVKDPATRNPACAVELDSRDKLVRMFSCSECEGGLAVACNGRAVAVVVVSVTSSHRYRIALFDYATGVETTSVCNYGDIGAAHGLRFHPDGARLFVADSFNHRVTVFAVNGAGVLAQIDVSEPWAVDFATTGDVLIAARGDNCVLVMSPDLSTELRRVKGTTELSCLNDIAIGPVSGLLYALDNTNGRVVVFE